MGSLPCCRDEIDAAVAEHEEIVCFMQLEIDKLQRDKTAAECSMQNMQRHFEQLQRDMHRHHQEEIEGLHELWQAEARRNEMARGPERRPDPFELDKRRKGYW